MTKTQHVNSFYAASVASRLVDYPRLAGDIRADVCVLGGGFAGLSTALHLAQKGTRVVLLERIRDLGSIAAAARSLNMAYSHAWGLVAKMNQLAGEELVSRTFGGQKGGRAWLTPAGEAVIARFWDLVAEFRQWLEKQTV